MFNSSSSGSSSSSNDEEPEEGEIDADDDDTKKRKSRVDPKEIPEVKNNFLMRAASKDDNDKEKDSDSDSKQHKKDKKGGRNDSRGFVFSSKERNNHQHTL